MNVVPLVIGFFIGIIAVQVCRILGVPEATTAGIGVVTIPRHTVAT